jgi:4-hydroxybenzoate polyprenyltransferase
MMMDCFRNAATRCLLWTNILMAGSAAGWVVVTARTLDSSIDVAIIALAFVLALAFYTRDRLDEREHLSDLVVMPQRTAWIRRHATVLKGLVWSSFFGAVILLFVRPAALPPILAGLGFALTYTVRWLPWRGRRVGWKHLPGMKTPFVAVLWTLLTVITPAAVHGKVWQRDTVLLAAAACVLIMVQILVNDLRDMEGDRASGTVSLPVLLGDPAARLVGYVLAVAAVFFALPISPFPFLLTAFYSAFLIWRYRRARDARWRVWIEAQGLVAGLVALVWPN